MPSLKIDIVLDEQGAIRGMAQVENSARSLGKTLNEINAPSFLQRLGTSNLEQGLKATYAQLSQGTSGVEEAYRSLGIKSDAVYAAMRTNATAAVDFIRNKTLSSTEEIARAEKAKAERIAAINREQFGEQASRIESLKSKWIVAAAAIGVAFGVVHTIKGFVDTVKQVAEAQEAMVKLSEKTGTSYEMIKVLSYGAKLADVDIQGLSRGLGILAKNMQGAAVDLGGATKSFDALGITTTDSTGKLKSMDAILLEVADKFAVMENSTGKTAYAMALFGKSGKDLIPLLNEGSDGIREMKTEMDRLGFSFGEAAAKKAEALSDNLKRLEMASQNLKTKFVMELVPGLLGLTEEFLRAKKEGGGAADLIQVIGNVAKGAIAGVIGLAGAFDVFASAVGRGYGKMQESLNNSGWFAKITGFANVRASLAGMSAYGDDETKKKIQGYVSLIDKLYNPTSTEGRPKLGRGDDAPLLEGKSGTDAMDQWAKKLESIRREIEKSQPGLTEYDKRMLDIKYQFKDLREEAEKNKLPTGQLRGLEAGLMESATRGWDSKMMEFSIRSDEERRKRQETQLDDYDKFFQTLSETRGTINERELAKIEKDENTHLGKLAEFYLQGTVNYEEQEKLRTWIAENAQKARNVLEVKKSELNVQLVQGIIGQDQMLYNMEIKLLKDKAQKWSDEGANKLAIEAKIADEMQLIWIKAAKQSTDPFAGMSAGLLEFGRNSERVGEQFASSMSGAFSKTTDALTDLVVTGKTDWNSLLTSITRDFTRIGMQSITGGLSTMLGNGLKSLLGGGEGPDFMAALTQQSTAKEQMLATTVAQEAAEATLTVTLAAEVIEVQALAAAYLELYTIKAAGAGITGGGDGGGGGGGGGGISGGGGKSIGGAGASRRFSSVPNVHIVIEDHVGAAANANVATKAPVYDSKLKAYVVGVVLENMSRGGSLSRVLPRR